MAWNVNKDWTHRPEVQARGPAPGSHHLHSSGDEWAHHTPGIVDVLRRVDRLHRADEFGVVRVRQRESGLEAPQQLQCTEMVAAPRSTRCSARLSVAELQLDHSEGKLKRAGAAK
eukprot:scaffold294380_cov30-Tisochrysis_lutea.AAC.1